MNAEYHVRRNIMGEGLNPIPEVVCHIPCGTFYCVADLPVDDADVFCQWLLDEFEHEGHALMMAPVSGFYAEPELGK